MFVEDGFFMCNGSISNFFNKELGKLDKLIDSKNDSYFLNEDDILYQELYNKFHIVPPLIEFEKCEIYLTEDSYPCESPNVCNCGGIKRNVSNFRIPIIGSSNLLKFTPLDYTRESSIKYSDIKIISCKNILLIKLVDHDGNNTDAIKNKYDEIIENIVKNLSNLINNIEGHNNTLHVKINDKIAKRKEKIKDNKKYLESFGLPIAVKDDNTENTITLSPNISKREINIGIKESVGGSTKSVSKLNLNYYNDILVCIDDAGRNLERTPSLAKGKGEEELRDYMLSLLNSIIKDGSATGETFNHSGKTDILITHNADVVFIAECKFWSGDKGYIKTITQLFGYLTWRNTKCSVIIFVKQKDFINVLDKIEEITSKHPNFKRLDNRPFNNWFNYKFHFNDDKNSEMSLAIQFYHINHK